MPKFSAVLFKLDLKLDHPPLLICVSFFVILCCYYSHILTALENIVNQLSSMPQLKALQTSEHHEKKKNKRELLRWVSLRVP